MFKTIAAKDLKSGYLVHDGAVVEILIVEVCDGYVAVGYHRFQGTDQLVGTLTFGLDEPVRVPSLV